MSSPAGQTMDSSGVRRRALLIGIRTYPRIPAPFGEPLAGCHNDVTHVRRALLHRGFDEADLEILVDPVAGCDCPFCGDSPERAAGTPIRDEILAALERLHEATAPGDVAVVYYSGHGSEFAGCGLDVGRRFQTFVPHDSGRGEHQNRDVSDREIEAWIRRMGERTPHLTMIFDCCHSGGISDLRGAEKSGEGARRVAVDEREEAEAYAPELRRVVERSAVEQDAVSRGAPMRGSGRSAVVLSGCAARELSCETEADGRRQGLFTHHLTRVLSRPPVAGETWADLFPEIAHGVNATNLAQHPRRGGNGPVFEPGEVDPDDVDPPDVIELTKLAVVVGINYEDVEEGRESFAPLRCAENDGREVARMLAEDQGYEIVGLSERHPGPLLGKKATRRRIHKILQRLAAVKARASRESAVVLYFAGHGVVQTSSDGAQQGFLVPWDADARDPSTWLAMRDLRDQLVDGIDDAERLERLEQRRPLARLTSRHVLILLDCCFGGAMAHDFFRGADAPERPIYYSEYRRFVEGTAWQLLSSSSFNQQALDRDPADPDEPHSPFARAVIEGLGRGAADHAAADRAASGRGDHLITAAELHQYVDRRLKETGVDVQTPGLVDLRPRDGQFIFTVPGWAPTPLPDPPLHPGANPWSGREPCTDIELFHGREQATLDVLAAFLSCRALAVVGPSGSGVTSLLRAGLLPILENPAAGRRRLAAFLRRSGQEERLISRQDLRAVRDWAAELFPEYEGNEGDGTDEERIVRRVREWAVEKELLDDRTAEAGPSRVLRESLGVPSFERSARRGEEFGWLRRLKILRLLERPALLAERLREWTRRGGLADFLSVGERVLPKIVGRFEIADEIADGVPESLPDDPERRVIVELSAAALACDAALAERLEDPRWRVHRVARPGRDDLRRAILGPAAARVLRFDPPRRVERLVDEAAPTAAPLALLSAVLAGAVERAWRRRGTRDRLLTTSDLGLGEETAAPIAALLAARAEALYRRLAKEDRAARRTFLALLLRAADLDGEQATARRVEWRELDPADDGERRRLAERVLPAVIGERLVVADEKGLELVSADLLAAWPRARRWLRFLRRRRFSAQAVWRDTLAWVASGCERGKLRQHDPDLPRLLRSRHLNRLERRFVDACEAWRREDLAGRLAAEALGSRASDWTRSLRTAVELVRTVESFADGPHPPIAEQTLRDVLAATPLSIPLPLPAALDGALEGLELGDDGVLRARVGGRGWQWDARRPASLPRAGEAPAVGEGEVRPRRFFLVGPEEAFPVTPPLRPPLPPRGPHAQSAPDGVIRFFVPGQLRVPPPLQTPPLRLLGHRGVARFLAFSPRPRPTRPPRWLASGAHLDDGGLELRLWSIGDDGRPLAEPRAFFDQELAEILEELGLEAAATAGRDERLELAGRVAVGRLDGRVELGWAGRHRPVVLPAPADGFAVRTLAFDRAGRFLVVERRGLFEPFGRRVEVYRLDLDELVDLAERCAGRPGEESREENRTSNQPEEEKT